MVDEKLIEKMWCNVPEAPEFRENIEIVEVSEPGYVHFTMDIPESLGNYRGGIHGGTGYFIGEIGCGFATYSFGVNNVCNSANVIIFKDGCGYAEQRVCYAAGHMDGGEKDTGPVT